MRKIFQSTRPIRGATGFTLLVMGYTGISIHAPHTGRDGHCISRHDGGRHISIHAPHTGRDAALAAKAGQGYNFNPRAPYGARLGISHQCNYPCIISIHAPHTGRDEYKIRTDYRDALFQSTRPIRGATSATSLPPSTA